MKRIVIAFAAAALCHTLLLFGFRADSLARPLPLGSTPQTVDVTLVSAPPAAPPEEVPPQTPPPAQEPMANSTPEPPAPAAPPLPPEPSSVQPLPPPPEPATTAATPIQSEPKPTPQPAQATPRPARPPKASASRQPASSQPSRVPATPRRSLFSEWRQCWDSFAGTLAQGDHHRPSRSNPPPRYPEEARRNGQQGVVLISAQVEADGRPSRVTLKQSSGFPLLDAAALEAVGKWTFEPARAGGLSASSRVDVPVRFALEIR